MVTSRRICHRLPVVRVLALKSRAGDKGRWRQRSTFKDSKTVRKTIYFYSISWSHFQCFLLLNYDLAFPSQNLTFFSMKAFHLFLWNSGRSISELSIPSWEYAWFTSSKKGPQRDEECPYYPSKKKKYIKDCKRCLAILSLYSLDYKNIPCWSW